MFAVAQTAGVVGMRPAIESRTVASQQLVSAPHMATPELIPQGLQPVRSMLDREQPLSNAIDGVQPSHEATSTHTAAAAQPNDSIAELCLFTYILRCGESCQLALAHCCLQGVACIPVTIENTSNLWLVHTSHDMQLQAESWGLAGGSR